jgi:hypothetical protein
MLASDINNLTFFPKGTILTFSTTAWGATSAEFKTIWKICNAANHAEDTAIPDLTDKFLRGAASPDTTGGADSSSVSIAAANLPVHSHGAGTLSVSGLTIGGITVDNAAAHSHTLSCTAADAGSHSHTFSAGSAAAAGGHTHTLTDPGHKHDVPLHSEDYGGSSSQVWNNRNNARVDTSSATTGITIGSAEAHTHTVSGTISDAAAHSHTISGTMGEGGSHSHTVNSSNATISGGAFSGATDNTGSGTALTIATLPAYYTVVYIMKVA